MTDGLRRIVFSEGDTLLAKPEFLLDEISTRAEVAFHLKQSSNKQHAELKDQIGGSSMRRL
jgi:hypothetical protein